MLNTSTDKCPYWARGLNLGLNFSLLPYKCTVSPEPSRGWDNIRIHHECEGGIEQSVPRITDWQYEACRVMTKGDCQGRIFLSHPHMNNGFFFLLTTKFRILYWKNMKKASRNPEFVEMRHGDVLLTLQ